LTFNENKRTLDIDLDRSGESPDGHPLSEGDHMATANIKLETPSATIGGGEEGGCCGGACCGGK
jgi:hypothetical protein